MPELPEVEHTRRNLERWMRGATIVRVDAHDVRAVKPKPAAFASALLGRTVKKVERRGKWLRWTFDDGSLMFGHLAMTGWFEEAPAGAVPLRFERVAFEVKRGAKMRRVSYVDARRWGGMTLATEDSPTWKKLGPDPLIEGIDEARLLGKLARRKKTSIKEVLLDQTVLAGVGNIQAIEALWKAGIDPRSRASALGAREVKALARALHWTIDRTLADLAKGDEGEENPFKIYGRKGTPCPRCKAALIRIELGGRTTTYCGGCQRRLGRGRAGAGRAKA
jgi:formamidopyrimidine-DNA glycosylase